MYGYCLDDPVNLIDPEGLSWLEYDDEKNNISIHTKDGTQYDFPADNQTVSGCEQFPQGEYKYSWHSPHSGKDTNSDVGENGNFIFDVPKHEGMGVHAGRADSKGIHHPTEGCIRTTGKGTQKIKEVHREDPVTHIKVKRSKH